MSLLYFSWVSPQHGKIPRLYLGSIDSLLDAFIMKTQGRRDQRAGKSTHQCAEETEEVGMLPDREGKMNFQPENIAYPLEVSDRKWEELRQVAYNLYGKKGKIRGTELACWFEAAQILKSRRG